MNNLSVKDNKNIQKEKKLIFPYKSDNNIKNEINKNSICEMKRTSVNKFKNIRETKVNNPSEIENNLNCDNNEISEKIKYIQKWWKIIYKIILLQRSVRKYLQLKKYINVVYLTKMIYKLILKNFIKEMKEKTKSSEKNKKIFKETNNKIKKNDIKKLKKYETSTKFNKRRNQNNNYILNNSNTSKNILKKKLKDYRKIKNDTLKSIYRNNELSSFNTINSNKENIKYILINNNDNNNKTINNNCKVKKAKIIKKEINNKEKIKAYNNIYNIYNNIKKIYENVKCNNNNVNFKTENNFHIKDNKIKLDKKKNENKKEGKTKKVSDKIIKNNRNTNSKINIIESQKKEENAKDFQDNNCLLNVLKMKKYFEYWKEYSTKRYIIKKLKISGLLKNKINDFYLLKNRFKNKKKEYSSLTTKKLNLSNSVLNQRLSNITPKRLILDNKQNKIINNYGEKEHKQNNSMNKNHYKINVNNLNIDMNKKKEINKEKKNEKIYYLNIIIKLLEEQNNKRKIKYYLNKWKFLIKDDKKTKGIEEKIISFKKVKSPFKIISNIPFLDIYSKNRNSIYQSNSSSDIFCRTELNTNFQYNHTKTNSIALQNNNLSLQPQNNFTKDYIYKSNMKSKKMIYKKKLLVDKRNKYINNDEEINFTLGNNLRDYNILNKTGGNFFKKKENKNIIINNSIYGGRILDNNYGQLDKLYNKIEDREICFTPKKNSIFKNNLGMNINVVEKYFNNYFKRDEIDNYNKDNNNNIKTKKIIFQ